jgi:uncharacterized damage-inducible protein DinB
MNNRENYIQILKRQQWVIDEQSKGLTHSDSMLQLPFRSNRFNWIVGHIVVYRDKMLVLLGKPPLLETEEWEIYQRGSDALTSDQDVVDFARLLSSTKESLNRLTEALQQVSEEALCEIYDDDRETTIQDRLEFLIWHETYHLGQLEILRQLAGKDDAII